MDLAGIDWKFVATAVGWLVLVASNILQWIVQRDKVNADRLQDVENKTEYRLDNHASRLKYLEACAEKAPSHQDLAKVHESINALASKVDKTAGCAWRP